MAAITKKTLVERARQYGCASLIGTQNAKTVKGEKREILTGILYMMPDSKLCPVAELAGCANGCLVSAGRAAFTPGIGMARAGRTAFFNADRESFMALLVLEIAAVVKRAKREGKQAAIRLNGTSDVNWANIKHDGKNVFEIFPDVQFYDYTKSPSILREASSVANWHITASYSASSAKYSSMIMAAAEKHNANVAVVFRTKKLPEFYLGRRVINGDETDLRFMDDQGVIVGLSAKGQAKKDYSGFVVDADNIIALAAA